MKKIKKLKPTVRLKLDRETIRALTMIDLQEVVGGGGMTGSRCSPPCEMNGCSTGDAKVC